MPGAHEGPDFQQKTNFFFLSFPNQPRQGHGFYQIYSYITAH